MFCILKSRKLTEVSFAQDIFPKKSFFCSTPLHLVRNLIRYEASIKTFRVTCLLVKHVQC